MASAFQAIKHEPGYHEGQPIIDLVDLGPFLIGNEVKTEPTAVRKEQQAQTTKRCSDLNESDEAKYRDLNLKVGKHKFGCRFCPIMYQSKRQLLGHVRKIHLIDSKVDETIYEKCYQPMDDLKARCKLCDLKQSFNYPDFKRHVYKVHETVKTCMECPACGGFYASSQSLQKHQDIKHSGDRRALPTRFKCEFCSLEYAELRNLHHHQYTKHKGQVKDAPRLRADRPKECELCGKTLRNANSLWSHKRITHHNELNLTKPQPTFNHQCPNCPMKYKWASNLSRHRRQVHENVQYICKLCQKSFGTRQAIYSHSFAHTKLVRYNCTGSDCHFQTMLKSKYVAHLRDEHEVVTFDQEKHDPDRKKFSYKKLIDYCCQNNINRRNESESDSEDDEEYDSEEA